MVGLVDERCGNGGRMQKISGTELEVSALCLGGNVFGWTADEQISFAVLDAFAEGGGNFIDTADMYSAGESESIIGRWMQQRHNRDDVVIATKVGKMTNLSGLSAPTIRQAVHESLRRLQTEHIDLYYAHADDNTVPLDETLGAFDELVQEGKVRQLGLSNYTGDRLQEALKTCESNRFAPVAALQPHYNLMERNEYEAELAPVIEANNLSVFPYFSLAMGFLTGKYRAGTGVSDSPRAGGAQAYATERGNRVLMALDDTARETGASVPAIALAWLRSRNGVLAPIASARSVEQLRPLMEMENLYLSNDQLDRLTEASDT